MAEENWLQEERRKIREELIRGGEVQLNPDGSLGMEDQESEKRIKVPKGKLANFYWYEHSPELLKEEKKLMSKFFPQFNIREDNGKLWWKGTIKSNRGGDWTLAAVYQNDHPNNSTYGGSIRIYSIKPDIDSLYRRLRWIPHLLDDEDGLKYLCTSESGDFKAFKDSKDRVKKVTSAASALSWASKWIFLFESWIHEEISKDEFASHGY